MAPPPNGFGAHDRDPALQCRLFEPLDGFGKLGGFHVVGISPERRMPPGGVVRFGIGFSASAQSLEMDVCNMIVGQRALKHIAVEMRKLARSREVPHVGKKLNFKTAQHFQEYRVGVGRMPDCINCSGSHVYSDTGLTLLFFPRS